MTNIPESRTPAPPSPDSHGAVLNARRTIDALKLPKHLVEMLGWLPENEWHLIEARACHLPITRDLADVTGFIDRVWTNASRAEHRSGSNRITGAEIDAYRARYDAALKALVAVGVEFARRAGLTEILSRNRRFLAKFGIATAQVAGAEHGAPRRAVAPAGTASAETAPLETEAA